MTTGVYGLADPDTGAVRWIAASRNIERAYKTHCKLAWKRPPGFGVVTWVAALAQNGKAPILQILQECREQDFNRVKREQVKFYELVGGADLNDHFSTNKQKIACC